MLEVVLDVETKQTFDDVGGFFPEKLGISFVGVFVRHGHGDSGEYQSYFEADLPKLFPLLEEADVVIGFNIDHFDIPTFSHYYQGNLNNIPTLDLMLRIQKNTGHRIGLDAVAQETLGTGKTGDGLDAIRYYHSGDLTSLEKYCLNDVKVTRDIYDYGLKYGKVKFRNKWNRLVETEVDFSFTPQKSLGAQMTLL